MRTAYPGRYGREQLKALANHLVTPESPSLFSISGLAVLPKRVYEGDSQFIEVNLNIERHSHNERTSEILVSSTIKGSAFQFTIASTKYTQSLEVSLVSSGGIAITPQDRESLPLEPGLITYRWSCDFPRSGRHQCDLVFIVRSQLTESGTMDKQTLHLRHSVLVAKLDHLTSRQVWALGGTSAVLATLIALLKALHDFGIWSF